MATVRLSLLVLVVGLLSCVTALGDTCGKPITVTQLPYVGTADTCSQNVSTWYCDVVPGSVTQGVWYFVQLATDSLIEASTCSDNTNLDTYMILFNSCHSNMGDDCTIFDDDYCSPKSRLSFTAAAGVGYWIFVTSMQSRCGTFQLDITELVAPTNQDCSQAIAINALPYAVEGTTTAVNVTFTTPCNAGTYAGLWYSLAWTADDATIAASTCDSYTNYDTQIHVVDVTDLTKCPGTICTAYNDDTCDLNKARAVFLARSGHKYLIFVTGFNNAKGRFLLDVEIVPTVNHATCTSAYTVPALPFIYKGSTADIPSSKSTCTNKTVPGLWFKVMGTGEKVIATTCNTYDNYAADTFIDVYNGCDTHATCMASNDDYCGLHSMVEFATVLNVEYEIFVAGWAPNTNGVEFTLTLQTESALKHDTCFYADAIEIPSSWTGSTVGLTTTTGGACVDSSEKRNGTWFKYYNSVATSVTVTTCNNETTVPTQIEVYFSCSMASCYKFGESLTTTCGGKAAVTFGAADDTTYYIYVSGAQTSGWIHAEFLTDVGSQHSDCGHALVFSDLPLSYLGETISSTHSFDYCKQAEKQGMWFAIPGTGNKVIAHTCDRETDFDTLLEAFSSCGETCLASNDDYGSQGGQNCGVMSKIEFPTVAGSMYYLFVTGSSFFTGVFMLDVYEAAPPSNDGCALADFIPKADTFTVQGFTGYSNYSGGDCVANTQRRGVWYSTYLSNERLVLDTCSVHTDFETVIEIYTSCDATTNVGGSCQTVNSTSSCTPQSNITFDYRGEQKEFYIFVSGVSDSHYGMFNLNIQRYPLSDKNTSDDGLSGGAIFGILLLVFVCVGVVVAAGVIGFIYYRRRAAGYTPLSS